MRSVVTIEKWLNGQAEAWRGVLQDLVCVSPDNPFVDSDMLLVPLNSVPSSPVPPRQGSLNCCKGSPDPESGSPKRVNGIDDVVMCGTEQKVVIIYMSERC